MSDLNTAPPVDGGGAPAVDGGQATDTWYSKFEDPGLRGYIENKAWKDPGEAVTAYRNLETFVGTPADRLLKLPEKADDPAWRDIHTKLGFAAPDKPEGYNIEVPEGASPEFADQARQWALKNKIPAHMMEGLSKDWNAWVAGQVTAQQEQEQLRAQADLNQLRSEWGQSYAGSVELARRAAGEAARIAGIGAEELSAVEGALGTAKFMRLFAGIGSTTSGEAPAHGTESPGRTGFNLSPEAAQARLDGLKKDSAWFQRYNSGDQQARSEWDTLNRIASGA
jgi:hypothetical protein